MKIQEHNYSSICALLIAAGASTRLGQPKQLVEYKGQVLIGYILDQINTSKAGESLVILGANEDQIKPYIGDTNYFQNPKWKDGMGTSISLGVSQLNSSVGAFMIILVDQYMLTTDIINEILEVFNDNPEKIIASKYNNDFIGPPVIFPAEYFNQLMALKGDQGAGKLIRHLLKENPEKVQLYSFPFGHLDVDVPEDINRMQR